MVIFWPFENLRRLIKGEPLLRWHWPFNHGSSIVGSNEWEAVAKGVVRHGYGTFKHMFATEWDIPTNKESQVRAYLESQEKKKYEIGNFLWHLLKIFTGLWWGSWNDDRHSCVELCARSLQVAGYDIPKYVNPSELYEYLVNNFGEGKVVKAENGFINMFFYIFSPVLKVVATCIVLYLIFNI